MLWNHEIVINKSLHVDWWCWEILKIFHMHGDTPGGNVRTYQATRVESANSTESKHGSPAFLAGLVI